MTAARTVNRGQFLWSAFRMGMIAVATVIAGSLPIHIAFAQAVTPTAEQLEMFNSLGSEQQQAILDRLGQSGNVSGATLPTQQSSPSGNALTELNASQRRLLASRKLVPEVPKLKEGEVIVVELNFPQPVAVATPAALPATDASDTSKEVAIVTPPVAEEVLTELEKARLLELMALVRSKNPYTLGPDASLILPGFAPISLQGLTVQQAATRVAAEPDFFRLQIKLTLLPLEKPGVAGLKPFGYELFDEPPSTFAPVTNVPVPADYVVGPGDELNIQLYGSQNRTMRLRVDNDGRINFPGLGPISVGGQGFSTMQSSLEERVSQQMIGVRAGVSMGQTRAIRVFVLGEANLPGSYTVSGLGTMTTALFASGGVKPIGSLRNIQLKRQGSVVRTLDLYDLLLKGDTSNDGKLLPGDVIFIPPVKATVAIGGEVRRPAIYELKGNQSATELVELAGGLATEADIRKVSLTRVEGQRGRVASAIDLTSSAARTQPLRNGDALSIARLPPVVDSGVTIGGYVHAPRSVAWRSGMRLSEVIGSVDDLKPNADLHYLLIRRELPPDRTVAVLSADLAQALASPGGAADIELMPRDQITVFDFEMDRARIIKPIMDELRLQSKAARPTEVVRVTGRIKVPGEYPLQPNMRVTDLIRAGGNLQDAAFSSTAELTRYVERNGQRTTELIKVDLAAILNGDTSADLPLQSADSLNIMEIPQWSDQERVVLRGEVRFPGEYSIQRGETLHSVIERAGGLTDLAFADGSVFTRDDLRQREQEQLDMLTQRMRSDLASLALQGAQANQTGVAQSLSVGQSLLAQLQSSKAVGRLVIDLDELLAGPERGASDVILRNGDTLIVPRQRQEVTVLGEVQTTTSHLYRDGFSRNDYISQSGGVTRRADTGQTYVVRANGSVVSAGNRWFSGVDVRPGDTIVVPLDTEKMPALPLWQAVTQIVYNIAIAAAAVNSF